MNDNLNKCPRCGGEADNGHDRCDPPTAYNCTKCDNKDNDKELAIKVAEKLKEHKAAKKLKEHKAAKKLKEHKAAYCTRFDWSEFELNKYLHDKAAEILFSEGMAKRIGEYYRSIYEIDEQDIPSCVWWNLFTTITPQKILITYLEMEGE